MKSSFIFRTLTLFFVCGVIINAQNVFAVTFGQAQRAVFTAVRTAPQALPQQAVNAAVALPSPANGNQVFPSQPNARLNDGQLNDAPINAVEENQTDPAQPNGIHIPSPTQKRTGYTRSEIRSMPLINRPNRPGHFVGNTIRRRAGVAY